MLLQRSANTSCMSYSPAGRSCSQSAARTAPLAKVMRLEALWVISTRSPSAANSTGWSPPRPGLAFATIDGHLSQVATQGLSHHLTHAQRRAGRCIDLVPVVRLDDLDIHVVAQHPRRGVQQLQAEVHPHAEIGGEDDGDVLGRLGQQQLFLGTE